MSDQITDHPVEQPGTNAPLWQIQYHLLCIIEAIDTHLQHQELITKNTRWRQFVKLAANAIRVLRKEVEQLRKDELELLSCPGDTILETLEAKGMHRIDLALAMSRLPDEIEDIIAGKTPINQLIAEQLEQVLGIDAQFWLNSEANYRKKLQNLRPA